MGAKKGNQNAWKGGRTKHPAGYILVMCKNHPYAYTKGQVLEHRLVMEKHLGRYLLPKEIVDHLNGIKDDNRIENLVLFNGQSDHIKEEHQRGKFKMTEKWRQNIRLAVSKKERDSLGRFICIR